MIEFDVETTGVQPWSGKQHAFMFQFFDPEVSDEAEALFPEKDAERIQWWFDRGATEGLRAWNSKFDRAFADIAELFTLPGDGCWYDGMIEAHTIDERRSVALKNISEGLFGDEAKDNQKEVHGWLQKERALRKKEAKINGTEMIYPDFSDVPLELMIPYGLEDTYLQRKVCDQYSMLFEQSPRLQGVVDFEMEVMDALYAMEKRGLPADEEGYRRLELEVVAHLDELEDEVQSIAEIENFNPKSSPQIIAALEARGADMQYMEKTDGKVEKADKDNLLAVDDVLAEAVLRFRSEFKVMSTYVKPMVQRHYDNKLQQWMEQFISPDGRIHANYRQVGARTGRMSCSGPNMQNQPRDDLRLRYNIKAEEGHKLVAVDLSNIEMRLFSAYAGPGRMLDAVRQNVDLHEQTAKFLGITDRKRAGGEIETARQRGKTFNFSVVYGGGLRTIRKQQRVDTAGARLLRKRYFDAYPEITGLQNRVEFRLEDQGYIEDLWGRRYRCYNAKREAYKFVNYLVQGTACEILKEAVVKLHADGVPVVGLIHDEVLAHVPTNDAQEVEQLINKRLTESAEPGGKLHDGKEAIIPLEADGGAFDRWSDAKKPGYKPDWALND